MYSIVIGIAAAALLEDPHVPDTLRLAVRDPDLPCELVHCSVSCLLRRPDQNHREPARLPVAAISSRRSPSLKRQGKRLLEGASASANLACRRRTAPKRAQRLALAVSIAGGPVRASASRATSSLSCGFPVVARVRRDAAPPRPTPSSSWIAPSSRCLRRARRRPRSSLEVVRPRVLQRLAWTASPSFRARASASSPALRSASLRARMLRRSVTLRAGSRSSGLPEGRWDCQRPLGRAPTPRRSGTLLEVRERRRR